MYTSYCAQTPPPNPAICSDVLLKQTAERFAKQQSAKDKKAAVEEESRSKAQISDSRARIDKLKFNKHVTHANMKDDHKQHQVCIAIHALNPMLHGLKGFEVRSSPFFIKAVCHNDVERNERYCAGANGQPERVTLA